MGTRQIQVADQTLVIHELDDVSDSTTGRALTGSWVWDSALVLSNWMATQGAVHFHFQDKSVLELGAGAGLPGLTAARLGASRVVLTDMGPLLPGLLRNVEANGHGDRVEARELVWGSDESPSQISEFDLILMSDVFYNQEEMVGLAKALKSVCGRGTTVWASTEVRPWTAECLSELVHEGFGLVELPSQKVEEMEEGLDCFAIFQVIPPHEDNQRTFIVEGSI